MIINPKMMRCAGDVARILVGNPEGKGYLKTTA
jgi:hypothetical protein